jgi:hypothetical protein
MNRPLISLLALLFACSAHAADRGCNVESDYDLTIDERSVILTRDSGTPKWIVIRQDRLFVDDRWVPLEAADRGRIAQIDRGARELMPLAREVGREAADIAFIALGEVAAGLSADPARSRERLDQARRRIDARLQRSITANRFDGRGLGDDIGAAVGEVVPLLVGDIVGGAIGAAFSGDLERLKGMEDLDRRIEALVEPRAKALETRADALCERMLALDALDNALAYRLPGGASLDLLKATRDQP